MENLICDQCEKSFTCTTTYLKHQCMLLTHIHAKSATKSFPTQHVLKLMRQELIKMRRSSLVTSAINNLIEKRTCKDISQFILVQKLVFLAKFADIHLKTLSVKILLNNFVKQFSSSSCIFQFCYLLLSASL